jgi:hypothetical protein
MMPSALSLKEKIDISPVQTGACVFILLPFEPKMVSRSKLENKLNNAIYQAKIKLIESYPKYSVRLILKKIKDIAASVDYSTHKKSIAIAISNNVEKIYYLDIDVEEKIIVDRSCKVRDIIYYKKQQPKYLLMALSKEKIKIFQCIENHINLIVNANIQNDVLQKNTASNNSSNPSTFSNNGDEIYNIISKVDEVLNIILQTYPLPLFVTSTPELKDYLLESKNKEYFSEFIPGNYVDATTNELQILLKPYIKNWRKIHENDLLLRLKIADKIERLSTGIKDVFKTAFQKRGKLLLIEENFSHPGIVGEAIEMNVVGKPTHTNSENDKDAVDDIIEQVLDNGGDIEFVRKGILKMKNHIALILL